MAIANHEAVWVSKNRLWEIRLDRNELYITNTKTNLRYSIDIKKNGAHSYWFTEVIDREKVPAYVMSKIEMVYRELRQAGEIM